MFDAKAKISEKLSSGHNNQMNESLHNSIAHFVPKMKDYRTNYAARADTTLLRRTFGKGTSMIYEQMHTTTGISIFSITELAKIENQYEKQKERKKKSKYKKQRIELKRKLSQIHKQTKKRKVGEKKSISDRGKPGACSCSKRSKCIRTCLCKKQGVLCTSKCSCYGGICTNDKHHQ